MLLLIMKTEPGKIHNKLRSKNTQNLNTAIDNWFERSPEAL